MLLRKDDCGKLPEDWHCQTLIDSITDYAIYMLNPDGRVLTWNRGAEINKGYRREEVVGQFYGMFFLEKDQENHVPMSHLATARQAGKVSGEAWRVRRDGGHFWASYVLTAILDNDGRLVGFAKVVRDLTEKKHQEEVMEIITAQLREERDRFHAAAEGSMNAIYICDALRSSNGEIVDFVITFVNSNVARMIDLSTDDLLGGRMREIFPDIQNLSLFEQYCNVVETGQPLIRELPTLSQRAKTDWVRIQVVKVRDGIMITVSDISEQKRNEQMVMELAFHDALTGLYNQRMLRPKIEEAIGFARTRGECFAILLIDLNRFKEINDTFGHLAGDAVLVEVSNRLKRSIHAHDTVFRLGGDEFVVIMQSITELEQVTQATQNLEKVLNETIDLSSKKVRCPCSIGTAIFPEDGEDVNALIYKADEEMYEQKRKSRFEQI